MLVGGGWGAESYSAWRVAMVTLMKITKRPDGWWIVNTPDDVEEMGPYDRRVDAAEDMAGVKRFLKEGDKRSFCTICKKSR